MAATGVRSVPDVIQAKKFEVVNDDGKVLVRLGANMRGNGSVTTQNGKGQTLVQLGSFDGSGFVETQNGKGQTLVALGTYRGGGSIETQDGKGQSLVNVSSTPSGGEVLVKNSIGKGVLVMMIGPDGSGLVMTLDPAGNKATSVTPSP